MLKELLYVPDIKTNMFSGSKASVNSSKILFENNICNLIFSGRTRLEEQKKVIYTKLNYQSEHLNK